jgi:MFS family permease
MMAYSFAVIAGFAGGGRSALFPVAIVNSFGGTHMAAIYGLSNTLFMIGSAIGPAIAGAIYESTGNAQYIYIMGVGVFVVSALLVSLIRDERPPSEA